MEFDPIDEPRDDELELDRVDEPELERGGEAASPPPRSGPNAGALILFGAVLALLAVAGWWLFGRDDTEPTPTDRLGVQDGSAAASEDDETRYEVGEVVDDEPPAERPRLDLPPLDGSDPVVRSELARLSNDPLLVRWLAAEDLARRFVGAVDATARGEGAREQLKFLAPGGTFAVDASGERTVVDDRNFRRFDPLVDLFTRLDIGLVARAYSDLEPLFEEAYVEIGEPGTTFRGQLRRAIDRLLAVEVPQRKPELVRYRGAWRYADPQLEALPAADKQLLRLGPERARRMQEKLSFLRDALDLSSS
ncbi:MAG: DUF3014 domain-containing protein [Acidobacteriota bacterium]